MLLELVGWTASLCLIVGLLPQAYHTHKTKTVDGLSVWMLLCCWVGFAGGSFYTILNSPVLWPVFFNYFVNLFVVSLLLWLYYEYKK